MLRSFLIYLSKADWAQRMVSHWKVAWRVASRFVAGRTLVDAIRVIHELNSKGIVATLDHLGENTSTPDDADKAAEEILRVLDIISCCDVCSNVSVKLTQIGLGLDERLCAQNLERILASARKHENFIRIDMEDTPYTDRTIHLYQRMRKKGYENVGIVIQSYLYRSENDIRQLSKGGARIRLVKGAYQEPPDKAYPRKADVDASYDFLAKILIDTALMAGLSPESEGGRVPPIPAIATHDEKRLAFAMHYSQNVGLAKRAIEFQMLYGIRRDLQEQLVKEGYPVRIYVPFGTHWYPYFMRRLAERPANLWFFISNFFRK